MDFCRDAIPGFRFAPPRALLNGSLRKLDGPVIFINFRGSTSLEDKSASPWRRSEFAGSRVSWLCATTEFLVQAGYAVAEAGARRRERLKLLRVHR